MHFNVRIDSLSLCIWFATVAIQICVGQLAVRRFLPLTIYLFGDAFMSLVGIGVAAFGTKPLFSRAYVCAGIVDDLLTILLLLSLLWELRKRARPDRKSLYILTTFMCAASVVAGYTISWPATALSGDPWRTSMAIAHTVWYWLCLIIGFIPLYAVITLAVPDRRTFLRLLGLGIYTIARAGLIDSMITKHFHVGIMRYSTNVVYFLPLVLWFITVVGPLATTETSMDEKIPVSGLSRDAIQEGI